nr:lamin tail domain-containing protein [Salsipaludibacter albus]
MTPPPSSTADGTTTTPSPRARSRSPLAESPSTSPSPREQSEQPRDRTTVERIVDGDTLYLAGLPERARLIGIDTPETVAPGRPVECFGPEASAALAELVPPGAEVWIEYDVERTDQYDRPLVYLYRASDDLFVNEAMVARGFAQLATFPPNVAHVGDFRSAQRTARETSRGLWGRDCEDGTKAGDDSPSPRDQGSTGGTGPEHDAEVVIARVEWDGPGNDVERNTSEHVVIQNNSSNVVDVGGWSVTDLKDHRITIPQGYRIPPGGALRVHTGPGDDSEAAYFEGAGQAIWNNSGGDTATLRDAGGSVVDEFSYSS